MQAGLSPLPFGVAINHRLQVWSGSFGRAKRAKQFLYQSQQVRDFGRRGGGITGATIVEIGSGWDLIGGLIFHLAGADAIHAFDLRPNLDFELARQLISIVCDDVPDEAAESLGVPIDTLNERLRQLRRAESLNELLIRLGVVYHAPGDASATGLEAKSVDIVFSYGTLEHIPEDALRAILQESRRILKRDGGCYHNIGTHDHFEGAGAGSGVNFLRYSDWRWKLIAGNKFAYHNRLRASDYLRMFDELGLRVTHEVRELRDEDLKALAGMKIDTKFSGRTLEDLATAALFVDVSAAEAATGG